MRSLFRHLLFKRVRLYRLLSQVCKPADSSHVFYQFRINKLESCWTLYGKLPCTLWLLSQSVMLRLQLNMALISACPSFRVKSAHRSTTVLCATFRQASQLVLADTKWTHTAYYATTADVCNCRCHEPNFDCLGAVFHLITAKPTLCTSGLTDRSICRRCNCTKTYIAHAYKV
jgi:hypothetical protein